ncbi:hypothetical protein GQ607_013054 [Colletotrichum asianum]|uniref:Uncharacterized protein n=1 Tax=Colletotrichum asianum TaxID=702518 RepID=A0A8H3ZH83_9PEZI|nr:hypothetical protein GQ607_013054 [Colletotrichum asianum]
MRLPSLKNDGLETHVRSEPDRARNRMTEPGSVVPAASTALQGRLAAFKKRVEGRARESATASTAPHSHPVGAYPQHVGSEPPPEQATHAKTEPESAVTKPSTAFKFDLNTCLGTVRYGWDLFCDLLCWIGRHFKLLLTLALLFAAYRNMPRFPSSQMLQYPVSLVVAAVYRVTGSTSSTPSLLTPITAHDFDLFRYRFDPSKLQTVVSSGDTAHLNFFKTIAAGGNAPALDLLEPVDRTRWNGRTPRTTLNDTQQAVSDFISHLRSGEPWLITFIQAQSRQDAGKDDAGQDESTSLLCWVRRRLGGVRSCESIRLEQDAISLYNWAGTESDHRKNFLKHDISWNNVTMITSSMQEDLCSMLESFIRFQAMDPQQIGPQPKLPWPWSNREKSEAMHLNKAACSGGKLLVEQIKGFQKMVADEVIQLDLLARMAEGYAEQARLGYNNVRNFSLRKIAVAYYEFLGRVYFLSR